MAERLTLSPETRAAATKRATYACARCYKLKRKCDNGSPACSRCVKAHVECVGLDRSTTQFVPRSLVQYLEQRIATLESSVVNSDAIIKPVRPSPHLPSGLSQEPHYKDAQAHSAEQRHDAISAWAAKERQYGCQRTVLGLRGSSFNPLIMKCSILPFTSDVSPDGSEYLTQIALQFGSRDILSLHAIPTHVAETLIKVYIEKILPQYPFFPEEDLQSYQLLVFPPHGAATRVVSSEAEFVVAMMMAISTLTSKNPNHDRLMSLSTSLYKYAMQRYDPLAEPSIVNLQCTMLLCQFANFCPGICEIWTLKGMAVRMAVAMGLHREPGFALKSFDRKKMELRRKMFWTLYSMDRSISIAALRPISLADHLINAKFPSEDFTSGSDPSSSRQRMQITRFLRHVKFRQIQSEIYSVNFGDREPDSLPYSSWMKARDEELLEWRKSLETLEQTGFDWFDFVMYTGQIYLHTHCPRNPHPDAQSVIKGFEAARGTNNGYFRMYCKGFLKFDWHCAHHVLTAATLLIRLIKHDYQTLLRTYSSREINSALDECSEVFTILSEKWPEASRCLKQFEIARSDLFYAFSLSADILMGSTNQSSVGEQQQSNLSLAHMPSIVPAAPSPPVVQEISEPLPDLEQVLEPSDLEPWVHTINMFTDYTESDWDVWAGQTEMHWPF
ncbi:hypothetical protein PV10_00672 [Exophiala mesophila]|uniref:Zn(2)-C6 fungal-type domain-containing protein n=1 Tax=Exophiala mesophila TaxID=212818 RepID=A0A0D1ZQG5_EXOME|nr:uncharacterized protein PV10_00672 [Exophiala mesophila]KIV96857.1 hypothetical protein PV10_00672 [Exophiala mesophila]